MFRALTAESRGVACWVDVPILVGSQYVSPLAWTIESGALHATSITLTDLLPFRADWDRLLLSGRATPSAPIFFSWSHFIRRRAELGILAFPELVVRLQKKEWAQVN